MSTKQISHRIHGHEVWYEPDTGLRCDCERWEANGWGCVHTLQVFWSESIEEHASELCRQTSPRRLPPSRLRLLEGRVERLSVARDLVDFRVSGEFVTVVAKRMQGMKPLQDGDHVSVVVAGRPSHGYRDVLAIRRCGESTPYYTGPFPGRVAAVLSGVAGFGELAGQDWTIAIAAAIAIPLAVLYVHCLRLRRRALRRLDMRASRPA
jgi:hypothetical protein